ncbi:tachylectin-related carbohydrate-binding protein [Streptomyces sp. DH10]|uniref:tachylectin-related carbohydrate-binding protein n=1 Tax=Streptomyces sp. DH10 TaxID=3040121 RepID=UPI00244187FE|nr:tachylectin-related carbohydrate-binding protein [Streptomyces sp. DH10]MDG9712638.1 tachylectin-related carbohydrate-binding protein [Streptomyces sp. DH10]
MPPDLSSAEYETLDNLIDAAGPIGTGVDILKFIYEFGKTSPTEYAIENISRELALIKTQLAELSGRLDTVTQRLVKAENLARVRRLEEHTTRLSTLAVQIQRSPGDQARAAEAAAEAGGRADSMLTDEDLWTWSDVQIVTPHDANGNPSGPQRIEPLPPEFKTKIALPVYSMALTIWVAAMLIDTGSEVGRVKERYGDQLDRHIGAVSLRFGWHDHGSDEQTLPEKIRSRITCRPVAAHKYAEDGMCTFTVQCTDKLARTNTIVREFTVDMYDPVPGSRVLCTVDPQSVVLDEQEIEDRDPGIVMLGLWEEMLKSIAASGHLPAQQFIGQFPSWTAAFVGMYGVDRDLNLDYFTQTLPGSQGSWTGPLRVGTSWSFAAIVPGGSDAVLAKQPTGNWLWYRHQGSGQTPPTDKWAGPVSIGAWVAGDSAQTTWRHFGAGYGVVYGIVDHDVTGEFQEGDLFWGRFLGYQTGQGSFTAARPVGTGWQGLSPVFSGSEGIIYGVRPTGVLRWYNHTGWADGSNTWAEPRDLNTGVDWRQFERIVSGGEGVIYGILPNGAMRCYRHIDWRNGGDVLEGPMSVGEFWRFYNPLFASQPGATTGVF